MPDLLKNTASPLSLSKVFFVILSGVFLFGCKNSSVTDNATGSQNTAMNSYVASIHLLTLPFRDSCYDTVAIQKIRIPDSLPKFKNYGQLIGTINKTEQYVAILYSVPADVQLPVLHTFNLKGEQISSLKLFIGNCCGENEDCSGVSTVEITKDLRIVLKDSVQTFERDKKKSDKKRNIQTLKKYEEFKIDSTGKIISLPR